MVWFDAATLRARRRGVASGRRDGPIGKRLLSGRPRRSHGADDPGSNAGDAGPRRSPAAAQTPVRRPAVEAFATDQFRDGGRRAPGVISSVAIAGCSRWLRRTTLVPRRGGTTALVSSSQRQPPTGCARAPSGLRRSSSSPASAQRQVTIVSIVPRDSLLPSKTAPGCRTANLPSTRQSRQALGTARTRRERARERDHPAVRPMTLTSSDRGLRVRFGCRWHAGQPACRDGCRAAVEDTSPVNARRSELQKEGA